MPVSIFLGQYKINWVDLAVFSAPAGDTWSVILLEIETVMSHSLLNIDLKHHALFNFSSLALA